METKIETTLQTEELPVSSDFIEEMVEQRVGPGILLLSPALQLMHVNRRAVGLPDREGVKRARILIIMEEVAQRKERGPEKARERFRLTAREHEVVRSLARGHTNKEIANALTITEQTVKEHVKHVMEKTRSTTRTGILARIFSS